MTKPAKAAHRLRWWTWLWAALLAVIVSGELYAVVDKRTGDTISESSWLLTKAESPWVKWPVRIVILGLFAWLGPHLAFGIWTT